MTTIAGVALHVSDMDKSLGFWRDLLGLRAAADTGWTDKAPVGVPASMPEGYEVRIVVLIDAATPEDIPLGPDQPAGILLMQFRGAGGGAIRGKFADSGAMHVAMWVDDFDTRVQTFIDGGYPPLGPVSPSVVGDMRLVYITDPDGFSLELLG